MLDVQLKHIQFRALPITVDGTEYSVFPIELPPKITKGGKTTGELEYVYAADEELKDALTKRRFELGNNPHAYVFGTKTGKKVKDFRRMWRELFQWAGLEWGRDKGLVWHTIRHEFVSRALEKADGDPVIAQEMARTKISALRPAICTRAGAEFGDGRAFGKTLGCRGRDSSSSIVILSA